LAGGRDGIFLGGREGFKSYRKPLIINKINIYTRKIHPKVHPSIIDRGFLLL